MPTSWLLAPVLVAGLSSVSAYRGHLIKYREGTLAEVTDSGEANSNSRDSTANRFEPAVGLAACEVVESRVRAQCRPPPEDIASWRQELEHAAEAVAEQASVPLPDGAIW